MTVNKAKIKEFLYTNNKENLFYLVALILILLAGIVIRIYFIQMPIRQDEAFTFMDYAQKQLSE